MEEKKSKQPFRAGFRLALAFFIGYNWHFIISLVSMVGKSREYCGFMIVYLLYYMFGGQFIFGIIASVLIGLITYLIFKYLVKEEFSRAKLNFIIIPVMLLLVIAGSLTMTYTKKFFDELLGGKEKIWEIDTVGDGKTHKWVHNDTNGKLLELDFDTNLDGRPDVWEYYKGDRQLYKKITDTDFDGKPDKTELIKDEKK